jgi:glycerophosphoryl diester phosphodiesterase
LVVAHRGGASLADGDVMEGIRRLVGHGVEAAEIDVRRTADGTLVVHHDADWRGLRLDRTTYDELRERDAPVRPLDDVLAAAAGRLTIDAELKESGYEAEIVAALLERVAPSRLILTSFLDEVVRCVKAEAPEVRAGLLVGTRSPRRLLADVFPFDRIQRCGADFLAPSLDLLATGLGRRARRRGVPLLLWTEEDAAGLGRRLAEPGLIGVVTDAQLAVRVAQAGESGPWV